MDIILIPGFWLDGSSWDEVVPVLKQAGHRTHALTLPGMESRDAQRAPRRGRGHQHELPAVNGEVPLPDRSPFDDEDLVDLDHTRRAAFRERAVPTPADVASDPLRLGDERRYDVPVTVIACEFPSAMLREWIEQDRPYVRELAKDPRRRLCRSAHRALAAVHPARGARTSHPGQHRPGLTANTHRTAARCHAVTPRPGERIAGPETGTTIRSG